MSKLFSRVVGFFTSRSFVGVDKSGNRYFTRNEEIDGFVKEKRWVIFKGEQDPTSIPVEWICWLNGQRKKAPTPEEMVELEARRERVRQNAALLKQEEERKYSIQQSKSSGKVGSPDLKSFIRQFPEASSEQNRGKGHEEISETGDTINKKDRTSEPSGSGEYFQPGTWQPPT